MSGQEPISLEQWERIKAAQEMQEDRRLISGGDYYELGERISRRLMAEEQQRAVSGYEARVKQQALVEEHQRRQARVDAWAEEHFTPEELATIAEDFHGEEGPEGESFHDAERRWRTVAERHLQEKERRSREKVVTDADIRDMSLEEYRKVWDVEKNRPKPGVRYEPAGSGDEGGYGGPGSLAESLAAAGLGSLNLRSPR